MSEARSGTELGPFSARRAPILTRAVASARGGHARRPLVFEVQALEGSSAAALNRGAEHRPRPAFPRTPPGHRSRPRRRAPARRDEGSGTRAGVPVRRPEGRSSARRRRNPGSRPIRGGSPRTEARGRAPRKGRTAAETRRGRILPSLGAWSRRIRSLPAPPGTGVSSGHLPASAPYVNVRYVKSECQVTINRHAIDIRPV